MRDRLIKLLNELSNYHRSKNELVVFYVKERLDKSFNSYYNQITNSYNYVSKNNELQILKKMK